MIMQVYAVKDKKADAFLQPFFSVNLGTALRSLQEVLRDENHMFSKHVDDFVLYDLGTFDDASGNICGFADGATVVCPLNQLRSSAS